MARRTRRIGDLAKAAGVGVETVRFYEREGLVAQPLKPERGWREYDKDQLRQLVYIRLGRELGLTLSDIKQVQGAVGGAQKDFCTTVRGTVTGRLRDIEAEIAALESKRVALAAWLVQCEQPKADCPLYRQFHDLSPVKRKRKGQ